MKNNRTIAAAGYVILALAAGLWLEHVLLVVLGTFGPTQPLTRPLVGEWTWCTVIGLGLTGATAGYLWINPRTKQVSMEIVAELRKVSWPSFAETRAATVAVVVFSLIAAIVLGFWILSVKYCQAASKKPSTRAAIRLKTTTATVAARVSAKLGQLTLRSSATISIETWLVRGWVQR